MPPDHVQTWWVTDAPVPDAITKLLTLRAGSDDYEGIALLVALDNTAIYMNRPRQELSEIGRFDPAEILVAMWADAVDVPDDEWEDYAEYLVPCGKDFPGLAARQISNETQPLD